jgi:hypothetical protein
MYLILILGLFTVNNSSFKHRLDMSNIVNIEKECPDSKVIVAYIDDNSIGCEYPNDWTPRYLIFR